MPNGDAPSDHVPEEISRDPVGFLSKYMLESVGEVWGVVPTESPAGSDDAVFKFTKCKALRMAREAGYLALDICQAHEAYWDAMAGSLPGRPTFRFTDTMKDGAPYCTAVITQPAGVPHVDRSSGD